MKLPNVSPEVSAVLGMAYKAAFVMSKEGSQPCLVHMDWPDEQAEKEIASCHAAGYRPAGIVAIIPGGKAGLLCYSALAGVPVEDMEAAKNDFGLALMAENFAAPN